MIEIVKDKEIINVFGGGDCICTANGKPLNFGLSSVTRELNTISSYEDCRTICCEVLGGATGFAFKGSRGRCP